jgi:hypothetical protein
VRRNKGWVFEYVTITMGHELAVPLRIREKLAADLRESAGNGGPSRRRERQDQLVRARGRG